jgi:hypothetical protein
MWIGIAVKSLRSRQESVGYAIGHGSHRSPFCELFEDLSKLSFEVQPAVKDFIAIDEILYIAFACLEEVWVDTGPHQRGDIDKFTANVANQVTDLASGGSDALLAVIGSRVGLGCG